MTKCQFTRMRLAIGNELFQVFGRELVLHHQNEPGFTDFPDRREVFDRVVRQLFVQAHIGRLGGAGGHQKGVAVRRRSLDRLGTQYAVGAGFVFDGDGLAPGVPHGLRDDAPHGVGGAASREGHDELDGFVGVGLRLYRGRCQRCQRSEHHSGCDRKGLAAIQNGHAVSKFRIILMPPVCPNMPTDPSWQGPLNFSS